MPRMPLLILPTLTLLLVAQTPSAPLHVGETIPVELDLSQLGSTGLVPKDNRDATQVETARQGWNQLVPAFKGAPAVRLRLPLGEARLPLLLVW